MKGTIIIVDRIVDKGGLIPQNKKIMFLGDSITDNGTYIAHMNMYFYQHMQSTGIDFVNLGVSSETASGLSEPDHPFPRPCVLDRIDRAIELCRPDWAVVCYGMNDGIYYPFSEERFSAYKKGILEVIRRLKANNIKVAIMTPPPFDKKMPKTILPLGMEKYKFSEAYEDYDKVLEKYGQWILTEVKEVAGRVIDIYNPMKLYVEDRRKEDPSYVSGDGVHPNIEGHWIIAKVLLKELFNLCLERLPDYIGEPEASPLFKLVMERHRLLSSAWKEHVGHTNPNKANALPLEEALREGEKVQEKIRALAAENTGDNVCKISNWKGYERQDFYLKGREGIIIKPDKPAEGKPWVWRTEFFDAFSYADMDLLKKGWHIIYYRISNMYGCPEAVALMKDFKEYVVDNFKLSSKAVLFGFSRGGLYAFNYTAKYPEDVSMLYLDAPVLNILSWPGGKGSGCGAEKEWKECLDIYGLDEKAVINFQGNPLNKIEAVAKAGIPIIMVAGDKDDIVPFEENGGELVRLYKEWHGKLKLILKPGVGHHPHSLERPDEIVKFILENVK